MTPPARKRKAKLKPTIGWREWIALPGLGVEAIKAKIDTGARTSALHAFDMHTEERQGVPFVRFTIHPRQRSSKETIECVAEVIDERLIRSSSGHRALRPVIRTPVQLGGLLFPIEITLAGRDAMGFRMLLGRQAMRGRFRIDPGRSYLGTPSPGTQTTPRKGTER